MADKSSGLYVEQVTGRFDVALNAEVFEASWNQVIRNHEALRASFHFSESGEAYQCFEMGCTLKVHCEDWSALAEDKQDEAFDAFCKEERSRVFDLKVAPLMRISLYRLAEERYGFVWTFHHAILDGRSFELVMDEWAKTYDAMMTQREVSPRTSRFSQYLEWYAENDVHPQAEAFWKQHLEGFVPVSLPFRKRTAERKFETVGEIRLLSPELTQRLEAFAKLHSVTMNTLLQAAWAVVLRRCSGAEYATFGATRACRHVPIADSESLIGVLINTLPLCVHVDLEAELIPWLRSVRKDWVAMRDYEHTPLEKILEWTEVPLSVGLFDSLVIYEGYERPARLESLTESLHGNAFRIFGNVNFPITLTAYSAESLTLKLFYDADCFDLDAVRRLLKSVEVVLKGFIEHEDGKVGDLHVLDEETICKHLERSRGEALNFGAAETVHGEFEKQVAKSPDTIALRFGEDALSYQVLNERANQIAHYMVEQGVEVGDRIGLYLERGVDFFVCLLSVLKVGGVYLPIDCSFPKQRVELLLQDGGVKWLLRDGNMDEALWFEGKKVWHCSEVLKIAGDFPNSNLEISLPDDAAAYINFTSGSTGKPNGILVPHAGVINHGYAFSKIYEIHEGDCVLQISNLSFDFLTEEIFPTWFSRGTVVLGPQEMVTSVEYFFQTIEALEISIVTIATAFWHQLCMGLDALENEFPECLRVFAVGGEKPSPKAYEQWCQCCPDSVRWLNTYGPTEATVSAVFYEPKRGERFGEADAKREIPMGRPIYNVSAYVLDKDLKPVPAGVAGELYLGGPGVALGYCNNPEKSKAQFIDLDIRNSGQVESLFRTGDYVCCYEDGFLEFIGREDDQLKINGYRVELDEVSKMIEAHPQVKRSVVIARQREGQAKELLAYYIAENNEGDMEPVLLAYLEDRLPGYMVPRYWVEVEAFPFTANGKVDREKLPEPQVAVAEHLEHGIRPSTITETRLRFIWEELLGVSNIGKRDDFYQLGGDSLKAIQLFLKVEKEFQVKIQVGSLVRLTTFEALARAIDESLADTQEVEPDSSGLHSENLRSLYRNAHSLEGERVGKRLLLSQLKRSDGSNEAMVFVGYHLAGCMEFFERDINVFCTPINFFNLEEPETYIEKVSQVYCEEIIDVFPEGVIRLCGFCFDGLIAYFVAERLKRAGREVRTLTLVDRPFWGPVGNAFTQWALRGYRALNKVLRKKPDPLESLEVVEENAIAQWEAGSMEAMKKAMDSMQLFEWQHETHFVFNENMAVYHQYLHLNAWKRYFTGPVKKGLIPGGGHEAMRKETKTHEALGRFLNETI